VLTQQLMFEFSCFSVCSAHAHHDQAVIPRLPRELAIAFAAIFLVSFLAAFNLMPVSVHMTVVSVATIYIGSRFALKCWKIEGGAEGEGGRPGGAEQMQTKDAMMFPVIGSVVLFSLYLVYKFLPKEWVNFFIKCYFFVFGCLVLAQKFAQILTMTLPVPLVHKLLKLEFSLPNPVWIFGKIEQVLLPVLKLIPYLGYNQPAPAGEIEPEPASFWMQLSLLDLIALAIAITVSVFYIATGYWAASNLFGIAFSVQGIEMLSLGSFLNGTILLCGLFFYDVFWVFGTDVMVTVAKSFDAPIKLLFPQFGSEGTPSMLGLGDIVIPGIFIALLLRFDIWMNIQRLKKKTGENKWSKEEKHDVDCLYCHAEKQKPLKTSYFTTNLIAYFFGLCTTVGVMYSFGAAQPALLYLVPACLGTSILLSNIKGEFKQLWKYTENEEEGEQGEKKGEASAPSESEVAGEKPKRKSSSAKKKAVKQAEQEEQGEAGESSSPASSTKKRAGKTSSSKKKRSSRAD
jgi:minor histocompatibility antigen H13